MSFTNLVQICNLCCPMWHVLTDSPAAQILCSYFNFLTYPHKYKSVGKKGIDFSHRSFNLLYIIFSSK